MRQQGSATFWNQHSQPRWQMTTLQQQTHPSFAPEQLGAEPPLQLKKKEPLAWRYRNGPSSSVRHPCRSADLINTPVGKNEYASLLLLVRALLACF
jgi:hypothetical protein